jgi:hypothetical protein
MTFHTLDGLRPENCAMLSSRKNAGNPMIIIAIQYGIRNAPVKHIVKKNMSENTYM